MSPCVDQAVIFPGRETRALRTRGTQHRHSDVINVKKFPESRSVMPEEDEDSGSYHVVP